MKKIFVSLGSKGGIGKTNTTINLCQVAAHRGLDFEYLELDNSNNTSNTLDKSSVFSGRMSSCKVTQAQEELFKAIWKAMKENKIIFCDIGGGTDTMQLIELLNEEFGHHDIAYILPFQNSNKQMSNLLETYNKIDKKESIYLVKNQVKSEDDKFRFFEGDKALGIESYRKKINPKNTVFKIFDSDIQQLPENTNQCMLDLCELAIQYSREKAETVFLEKAKDMNEYNALMQKYTVAAGCLKEIERLNTEFDELFSEGATQNE